MEKDFGRRIMDIIRGRNLTRQEAKDMFEKVLHDEVNEIQQGAFLAALVAKGETPEEIAGSWEAIYELDTVKVTPSVAPLVENCGTGMDPLKTFNISTTASVVGASCGVYMAKHGARAITSSCGAVDLLEAVGVDVECGVETVKRSIERAGIGIFNGMSPEVHPQALFRILSKIHFGTTLNIAGSLANPAKPEYGVRGVYSRDLIEPVLRVMREIGYRRAIVFHGLNHDGSRGMDEISTLGETFIGELHEDGELTYYTITPEDLGLERADEDTIRPFASREEAALNFVRILSGVEDGARGDIVAANTAPILYIMGKACDLRDGVLKAKEVINSGKPVDKLREWVSEQNRNPEVGISRLEQVLRAANL
ncbi:MAG TPA: anthranilate phosphoribosyltransferase [Candidatus Syntrophoarchaeum butanivorans]|uniref:Anthranilate phosphoribosyltransferase n=1 Tax=Candidatus Syntropharchaeum butanivorans TaxID=1839936 RepID=A0A1F2P451_9EURY|nr:MAG: anthranilate phosphoribosyltransferase [Candidatus Syntrophoarchaeum butanivorans]HEC56504.1 anthranilate phosphoribosyltransferase [Candidatus Syntrophoarchaeum butanivorans]